MSSANRIARAAAVVALVATSFLVPSVAFARGAAGAPPQREAFEAKLRMRRAEGRREELKRNVAALVEASTAVSGRVATANLVSPGDRKTLERVNKLAKRVRADIGGAGRCAMAEPPTSVRAAAEALGERARRFDEKFGTASRYVVNLDLVELAGEMVVLSELIKTLGEARP